MHLLITRSEPGASRLAAEFTAAGLQCTVAPLLAAQPTHTPLALNEETASDDCFTHVIFVSEHAVLHAGSLFAGRVAGVQWYAIGPATGAALASALGRAGIRAQVRKPRLAQSEGLLAEPAMQQVTDAQILLVAGERSRPLLAETLVERGARVTQWAVYRRQPLAASQALTAFVSAAAEASAPADSIHVARACVASSGDGLELLSRQWFSRGGGVNVPVCVPSPRVADLARDRGWRNVVCCAGASATATLEGLQEAGLWTDRSIS